jgi:hypothetical protein
VGAILVHESITLDGIIEAPVWTAESGFDPAMAEPLERPFGRVVCRVYTRAGGARLLCAPDLTGMPVR